MAFKWKTRTFGATDAPVGTVIADHAHAATVLRDVSMPIAKNCLAPALKGGAVVRCQLGMSCQWSTFPGVSVDSRRMPNLTQAVFGWLRARFPHAVCTSVTVAWHRMAPLHLDGMNIGLSHLTAIGAFSGGGLWVASGGDGTTLEMTSGEEAGGTLAWHIFNPLLPHLTLPFEGDRAYLSFYTHQSVSRLKAPARRELLSLGIPLPSTEQVRDMQRERESLNRLCGPQERMRQATALVRRLGLADIRSKGMHKSCSWVCRHCGRFGRHVKGQPRRFCNATHQTRYKRAKQPMKRPARQ